MSPVSHIDDANFESEVVENNGLVLVDFWAPWCQPCHMIAPILEQISDDLQGKIDVKKINVDENPAMATKYGIRSIPNLILFKEGKVIEQLIGVRPKEEIKKIVEKYIEK